MVVMQPLDLPQFTMSKPLTLSLRDGFTITMTYNSLSNTIVCDRCGQDILVSSTTNALSFLNYRDFKVCKKTQQQAHRCIYPQSFLIVDLAAINSRINDLTTLALSRELPYAYCDNITAFCESCSHNVIQNTQCHHRGPGRSTLAFAFGARWAGCPRSRSCAPPGLP